MTQGHSHYSFFLNFEHSEDSESTTDSRASTLPATQPIQKNPQMLGGCLDGGRAWLTPHKPDDDGGDPRQTSLRNNMIGSDNGGLR